MLIRPVSGASQNTATAIQLRAYWLEAWKSSARQITSSGLCRAACHLMATILNRGLLYYSQIADVASNMISSMDLNGPAHAVDSSVSMLMTVASLRTRDNLRSAYETLERILRWLFVRWSPSKRTSSYGDMS